MDILEKGAISKAAVLSDTGSFININTLFGVVVVLAVLLLIVLVYLASIMSYLKNNTASKTENNSPVNNAAVQIASNEQVELSGDSELVAVITAAIYASMGDSAPADGLVVRSIRRAK
jgi:sodium pump decarboxylase gamma subunit